MACGSCVEKLALKLIDHHRRSLDYVRALELAEKGVERHEGTHSLSDLEKAELPFDPDYGLACITAGVCTCKAPLTDCSEVGCENVGSCGCSCPGPSVANSHYVSNTCLSLQSGCICFARTMKCVAGGACVCSCVGSCFYSCDAGYVWNPAALTCDLVAAAQMIELPKMGVGL